jgi:hypothetical protein
VLLACASRSRCLVIGAAAALLYLGAITWDGRFVLSQLVPHGRIAHQHLVSAMQAINTLPRSTVLSDPETSMLIPTMTHQDVVWFLYLKNVLISHADIARRYCLTQLPINPAVRRYTNGNIWPDADAAFPGTDVPSREIALMREACIAMDNDPIAALREFRVQYVLWNEAEHPDWDLRRLRVPLTKIDEGGLDAAQWSLWKLGTPST